MNGLDFDTVSRFAQSWGLVLLLVSFIVGIAFAFLPGRSYKPQADIPFRHDDDAGGRDASA